MPSVNNKEIEKHLEELLTPAVFRQMANYRALGMRSRILTLPLMVAAVLTLLWRQVPSVHELTRMLAREDLLWSKAVTVSQQALSQRFLSFPSELFEGVYRALLPELKERWEVRQQRPLPPSIQVASAHFKHIWAADGSTLEGLFRKLDSLEQAPAGQLAGKMCMVIDLIRQLPVELWFCEQAQAFDTRFIPDLLKLVDEKTLLILDRGFYDFQFFADLTARNAHFITRLKKNAKIEVVEWLSSTDSVKDMIIHLGTGQNGAPMLIVRVIEVRFGRSWYRYVTSVLEPEILPPFVVADLYRRRWRIEDAFNTAKRLLNLAYLWTGSINGIQLQIWATWLFYAVLVDLGDAVADAMNLPFDRISLEMLFRGLYHFIQAFNKGKASDPVSYFAAPENQDLGIIKRIRKRLLPLDLSPYPTPTPI